MAARPPESLVLPRLLQASPLRAMISPLPPLDIGPDAEFAKGSVLLLLFDPDNVPRTSIDWLARLLLESLAARLPGGAGGGGPCRGRVSPQSTWHCRDL